MGCGSSKYMRIQYEFEQGRNAPTPFLSTISLRVYHRHPKLKRTQHLVALTSTTYGVWNLLEAIEHSTEKSRDIPEDKATSDTSTDNVCQDKSFGDLKLNLHDSLVPLQTPEVIDASELMAGLEEDEEDSPGAQCQTKFAARSPLRVAAIEGSTRRIFYAKSVSISSLHDLHQLHAFLRGNDRPQDDGRLKEHYPCIDLDRKRLLSKQCDKENVKPVLDSSPHRRSSLNVTERNERQCKRTPLKASNRMNFTATEANALIVEAASVPQPGDKCDDGREESQYKPLMSDRGCSPIASLLAASPSRNLSARKTSRRSSSAVSARWSNINAMSCIEPTTPYGSFHRLSLSHQSDNLSSPIFDPDLLASFETAIQVLGVEQDRFSSRLLRNATSPYPRNSIEAISPSKANNIRTPLKPIQIRSPFGSNSTLRTPLKSRIDRNICSTTSRSITATADLKRNINTSIIRSESSDIKLLTSDQSAQSGMKGSGGLVDIRDASVKLSNIRNPLDCLRKLCPPGGEQSVVLYTTSLRGIRKTFDNCCCMQAMLQSLGIHVDERDVSMHAGFLQELKELLGPDSACVPRLFIRGYYVGGKEEALKLYEEGVMASLVAGMRRQEDGGWKCDGCGGMRFLPCLDCSGSCKIVRDGGEVLRCSDCNENGLIRCPICC